MNFVPLVHLILQQFGFVFNPLRTLKKETSHSFLGSNLFHLNFAINNFCVFIEPSTPPNPVPEWSHPQR